MRSASIAMSIQPSRGFAPRAGNAHRQHEPQPGDVARLLGTEPVAGHGAVRRGALGDGSPCAALKFSRRRPTSSASRCNEAASGKPVSKERPMKRIMITILLAASLATPAAASNPANSTEVPVGFDLLTRAVFGIPLTILGTVAMIPVGFVTLITRPTEIEKPFDMLVMGPARYTWVDPLGDHPDRSAAPIVGQ
jgi:hypothetical protein